MILADTDYEWAQRVGADEPGLLAIGEDDHDFSPLPCCGFCGTEDNLVVAPPPSAPVCCLRCACETMLMYCPETIAFVGGLVARSFQAVRQ